jgi:hypothetical protein
LEGNINGLHALKKRFGVVRDVGLFLKSPAELIWLSDYCFDGHILFFGSVQSYMYDCNLTDLWLRAGLMVDVEGQPE